MNLVWHIILKDIRRDRWALLFWALLFVAQILLGIILLHDEGTVIDRVITLKQGNILLVSLQFAMGFILVIQWVQADELTGTRMFWSTRPISAARLLAAKALGVVAVFGVLPVLLLLPWWLWCHYAAWDLLWVAIESFGWQLLLIAPAFLIAALTDGFGRALMWSLLLIALLTAGLILRSKLGVSLPVAEFSGQSGLIYTRLWLAAAVLVIGAAQVAADQFLRRRLVRSVTAAAVVLGVVALVGRFWPWDGSGFLVFLVEKEPAPRIQVPADAVQLFAGSAQLQGHTDDKNSSRIQQNFLVKGVPTGLAIGNPTFAQTWSWLDRSIDRGANGFFYPTGGDRPLLQLFSLPELAWDPETMRWLNERQAKVNATRVARGLSPLPETRPATLAGIEIAAVNFLPDADVARMQAQPPVYQARVQLSLSRLRLITECGLAPGIRRTGESRSVQLLPAIRTSDRVSIGAVMTAPALWKNGLWYAGAPPFPGHGWSSPLEAGFFAIDRAAGTYSWVSVNQLPPPVVQVAGVHISWHRLAFTTPKVVRDGHWVVRDPEWFDHTTLAIVSWYEGLALINREVKVEQYKLETPAPETTGKTF